MFCKGKTSNNANCNSKSKYSMNGRINIDNNSQKENKRASTDTKQKIRSDPVRKAIRNHISRFDLDPNGFVASSGGGRRAAATSMECRDSK